MTGAVGAVESIFVVPEPKGAATSLAEVDVVEGRGLDGDRYAARTGTWYKPGKTGQHVTLIEGETIDRLAAEGIVVAAGDTRRNIVTRGIRLDELVGRQFRIGDAVCVGVRPCPPCAHLESLTVAGLRAALEGGGGLRADVVTGGRVAVGAVIQPLDEAVVNSRG